MPLILVFLLGVANFALYRALMESDHPVLGEIARRIDGTIGAWGLYAIEAVVLVVALWFARQGSMTAVAFYGIYFAANVASFMLLKRVD